MKEEEIANKDRGFGLYNLALIRIKEKEKSEGQIIPFPKVFEVICRSFSIKKKEAWEVLFILRDFSKIKLVPYHGIILKNE